MTFIISNKQQQEKIKQLALPVFDGAEKVLGVLKANGDKSVYDNVLNAVLNLNKVMFLYRENIPTWDLQEIQTALHKLVHSMSRIYRANVPYKELQNYLDLLDQPAIKTDVFDKVKQVFVNISKNAKLRGF